MLALIFVETLRSSISALRRNSSLVSVRARTNTILVVLQGHCAIWPPKWHKCGLTVSLFSFSVNFNHVSLFEFTFTFTFLTCAFTYVGLSSDVYSFAILMWEMLTLKAAYESYTREKHYKEIVVEGKRPKVPKSCPFVIKDLLERSWHKQPSERPTFGAVCELIRFGMPDYNEDSGRTTKSYKSLRGGYDDEADHHDEILESDTPSDSLSQSIRIKSPHLDLHKHHSQNAIPAIGVVEE